MKSVWRIPFKFHLPELDQITREQWRNLEAGQAFDSLQKDAQWTGMTNGNFEMQESNHFSKLWHNTREQLGRRSLYSIVKYEVEMSNSQTKDGNVTEIFFHFPSWVAYQERTWRGAGWNSSGRGEKGGHTSQSTPRVSMGNWRNDRGRERAW